MHCGGAAHQHSAAQRNQRGADAKRGAAEWAAPVLRAGFSTLAGFTIVVE